MWNPSVTHQHLEKRVVIGRVRPTWARNLPEFQDRPDEDKDHQAAGIMPHSEPPSPTEDQQGKQEDKYDVFGKVSVVVKLRGVGVLFLLNGYFRG